ncbi:MAG: hypothetical protein JNL41_14760, partial [Phenylobacterium sp.]|uniref:hypothetical protein n=1 Tax=Phenylobacterium sp. TaxID=1871053 RepID=UPI001A588F2A
LVDCAYALGMAVGEAAKAEADTKKSFGLYDLFHRSFLAVRMGIRLAMALRAGPKPAAAHVGPTGRDSPERERLDSERAEPGDPPGFRIEFERDRDRDRDYEPVSLPRFLSTLGLVARDAGRASGLPADVRTRTLPALKTLLDDAGGAPAPQRTPGVAVLSRPPPATAPARASLLGSTAPTVMRPRARPKPPWSNSG